MELYYMGVKLETELNSARESIDLVRRRPPVKNVRELVLA